MGLDLRLPIGALFLVIGLLLASYGFLTGVAIDGWWGLVMVVFGGVMLSLALRARRA